MNHRSMRKGYFKGKRRRITLLDHLRGWYWDGDIKRYLHCSCPVGTPSGVNAA